jgi:hypothetical protein
VIETKSVAPLILVSQFVAFALNRKHTVTGMKIRSIQPNQFGPPQPEPKRSPTIAASRTPAPRIPLDTNLFRCESTTSSEHVPTPNASATIQ